MTSETSPLYLFSRLAGAYPAPAAPPKSKRSPCDFSSLKAGRSDARPALLLLDEGSLP